MTKLLINISNITLTHFLFLSIILFCIGLIGIILNSKDIIKIFLSLELIFLSINIILVASSYFLKEINGQIFTIFIVGNIAIESAIGLALLLNYFFYKNNIQTENLNTFKK